MKSNFFGAALTVIVLCFYSVASAQTYAESALQFSRTALTGSARIQALGGAQIALGGDYSSALSNPAGLGLYNRSEVTIGTAFTSLNTSTEYLGNKDSDFKSSLNIPGFSIALHFPKDNDGEGFLGGTFVISMSRTNDFNQSTFYQGSNKNTSIIDSFIGNADSYQGTAYDSPDLIFGEGQPEYNSPTGLAYYNYLIGPKNIIDPNNSNQEYFTDVTSIPYQQETIKTKGRSNQWSFAYGGNYSDKLFFGGSIGITSLNYSTSKSYSENFNDEIFSSLTLNETLTVRGSGINATVGAIGRPANFIQIGMSFSTPTVYSLSENYEASMNTYWKNYNYKFGNDSISLNDEFGQTDIVTSNYTLVTPLKFSSGVAFISKFGFITGDIELTNPATARYSSNTTGPNFSGANRKIKSTYKTMVSYRIGAEFRHDIFRARLGYGVQANAYRTEYDNDNKITSLSGGVGIKNKKFFLDFALINSRGENIYSPYDGAPTVAIKNSLTKGIVTFGLTF